MFRVLSSSCSKSRNIVSLSRVSWIVINPAFSLKGARSIPQRDEPSFAWLRGAMGVIDDGLGGLMRLLLEFV